MHQFSRVRYSARHRSLGAAGSASRNERGARRLFERSLATRIPAGIKALVRSVGWLFVFNSNSVRMNQEGRPDCGIEVVSFFHRAWSQGGSLSELAKAPGTGLTTTRG